MIELKEQLGVDEVVAACQRSWNADGHERPRLRELSLKQDAELVRPNARPRGREEVVHRIVGPSERWLSAHVEVTPSSQEHHGLIRYACNLRTTHSILLGGLDAGELALDGRLRPVVQVFGPFPTSD